MASVKNKDTKPEINIRRALFAQGLRYRLHDKELPGSPDLIFPKYKAIIFIHGCFWHHHDCKYGKLPTSNIDFWGKKLQDNAERDSQNIRKLEGMGWRVKVIWLCELKNKKNFYSDDDMSEIIRWIKGV